MKKKKMFFYFVLLLMFLLCPLIVMADKLPNGNVEQGSQSSNNNQGSNACDDCKIWSYPDYPFGYRIYLSKDDGTVLARTDVLTEGHDDAIHVFEGMSTRIETIARGAVSTEIIIYKDKLSEHFVYNTPFTQKLKKFYKKPANFNEAFINRLNLKKVGEGFQYKMYSDDGITALSRDETISKMIEFFEEIGLFFKEADFRALLDSKEKIYLVAEPMEAFKVASEPIYYVMGTGTEMTYYFHDVMKNSDQNRILLTVLYPAGVLTQYDGAGYYKTTYSEANDWHNNKYPRFSQVKSGNKKGGLVEGISVLLWRLNDIIEDCNYTTAEEKCSEQGQALGCSCSCEEAITTKYKNNFTDRFKSEGYTEYPSSCSKKPPGECEYKMKSTIPSSCDSTTSGKVKDVADWKCIFESTKYEYDETVRNNYYESDFTNSYCKVYCKEEIEVGLPTTGAYTYQGQYLIVADSSGEKEIGPITITGTKKCRVTSKDAPGKIDHEKFYKDFKKADEAVQNAWDALQKERLRENIIANKTTVNVTNVHCETMCCPDNKCCEDTSTCRCPRGGQWDGNTNCNVSSGGTKEACVSQGFSYDTGNTICYYTGSAIGSKEDKCSGENATGTYYKYSSRGYKEYDGDNITVSVSDGSCSCNSSCGTPECKKLSCTGLASSDVKEKEDAYNAAVANRTNILEDYIKCFGYTDNYIEFNPQVDLYYYEPTYEITTNLEAQKSAMETTTYYTGDSTIESPSGFIDEESYPVSANATQKSYFVSFNVLKEYLGAELIDSIKYHDCGKSIPAPDQGYNACTGESNYFIPKSTIDWYETVTTKSYKYVLKSGLYQYILKSGQSVSYEPTSNYKYISFPNLPVHFSTNPGNYDFNIIINSFGENNKFNKYFIEHKAFNTVYYDEIKKYECEYRVDDDITIEDVLYRTISLYQPFPGKNGTTRTQGKNWQSGYGYDLINMYITNNRGVNTYDIYKLDPLYEVELTPSLMAKIKGYNSTKNTTKETVYIGTSSKKTLYIGYSDFNLTCNGGEGKNKKCKSNVIRDWGVRGCAISTGKSNYTNCNINDIAW